MPRPQSEAPRVVQRVDRLQDPVEIEERLAHPHEDDVGQALPVRGQAARGVADLVDDLGGLEVAGEAQLAGRAERAADGTAGLARDAQRVPLALPPAGRIVHEDRLDESAVGQSMEGLLGQAAVGEADLRVADGIEPERLVELGPEARRQRPDLGRGIGLAAPDGIGDLASPEARGATRGEPRLELASGEPREPGQGRYRRRRDRLDDR